MTSDDIDIRVEGCAGRITLNRPQALNALTYEMCLAIEQAIDHWAIDPAVALVLIDATGERAFCAGGDIAEMYATGIAGDLAYGRRFWRDEYRLNAKLAEYAKPLVSLMQGYTMGGGVGIGCHAAHRIVCENSRLSMPECNIGLVPDVGGSRILARAPGRLGEYLGITAARMGPGDAVLAGFADHFVPSEAWDQLVQDLVNTGDPDAIFSHARRVPEAALMAKMPLIDAWFGEATLADICDVLAESDSDFAKATRDQISRSSPLSAACTLRMIRRLRPGATLREALEQEFRFTYRAMQQGDFLEGIRAAIIDKDRTPCWRFEDPREVPGSAVDVILAPLGPEALTFEETEK